MPRQQSVRVAVQSVRVYCPHCDQELKVGGESCFNYALSEEWDLLIRKREVPCPYCHQSMAWSSNPFNGARRGSTIKPTIVTLCGSTRFSEEFHAANLRETLAGKIVLSIGYDFKSDTDLLLAGELKEADKERLDELHLRKIDLADEVLILNVAGYVGQSTRREIEYARRMGKRIRWLEEERAS